MSDTEDDGHDMHVLTAEEKDQKVRDCQSACTQASLESTGVGDVEAPTQPVAETEARGEVEGTPAPDPLADLIRILDEVSATEGDARG